MEPFTSIPVIVTVCCAVIAAITDATRFKVYNTLTVPLALSGLVYHTFTGGVEGFGSSLLGMVVGFGLLVLPFLMGGMGGGDVKLLAGIGAWVGVPGIIIVFVFAGLMSGICALALLLWQKRSLTAIVGDLLAMLNQLAAVRKKIASDDWVEDRVTARAPARRVIPFGVMVAFSVIVTFALTPAI